MKGIWKISAQAECIDRTGGCVPPKSPISRDVWGKKPAPPNARPTGTRPGQVPHLAGGPLSTN